MCVWMAFVADATAAADDVVVAAAARISFYKLENLALGFGIFFSTFPSLSFFRSIDIKR